MEKNKIDQLHKLSFLKRNELYTSFLDNFSINLGEIENNPFLGYVGKEYSNASKKLCFVAKSGAESTNFSYNDKVMNGSFIGFRKSQDTNRVNSFWFYQDIIKKHICMVLPS